MGDLKLWPSEPSPFTCSECFATVDEMFAVHHENWHKRTSRPAVTRRVALAQPLGTYAALKLAGQDDDDPLLQAPWLQPIRSPEDLRDAVVVVDFWGTDAVVIGRVVNGSDA